MKKFLGIVGIILLLLAGYIYWIYYRVDSDGHRPGMLQKFSRKGSIFKTYEGELIQSSMRSMNTKTLYFSVTDQKVADQLEKNIGKEMILHYVQYKGSLPWRGDNYDKQFAAQNGETDRGQYIVDGVEIVNTGYAPINNYPGQPQQQVQQQVQQPQQVPQAQVAPAAQQAPIAQPAAAAPEANQAPAANQVN